MSDVIILSEVASSEQFPSVYFEIADEQHFWCRWRLRAFTAMLKRLAVTTDAPWNVLDVGCGNGVVRRQVEGMTAWVTDGTDFPMEALKRNTGVKGETYLYNISEEQEEFRQRYDAVLLFDVLEHIHDTTRFLKSISYHLKPGGWLFINVPALELLRSPYDDVQGHLRRYSPELLRREFAGLDFSVAEISYWGLMQIPLLVARKIVLSLMSKKEEVYTTGFQPPAAFLNSALTAVMKCETALTSRPPVGTSVMGAFRKNA
ncbi:MAG: class I SAM-dependent methyltransferase [Ignavibacteriales bacterium]|nr:class I SAM-dependent methyltransferase [Ignavibacteriales bacterium]